VEYPFRVQSDFLYLSGFEEPDSVLLLIKKQGMKTVLFLRDKNPEREIWDGRRLGVQQACDTLGLDDAYSIDDLQNQSLNLISGVETIYISFSELESWFGLIHTWINRLKEQVRSGVDSPAQIADLDTLLHEQRVFKTRAEIKKMRKAAQISVEGHLAAMRVAKKSAFEYQVQAELESTFVQQGSPRVAFNSIVASEANACVLHYTENNAKMVKSGLVLVDAGAEWQGYAGDITTTFPASGRFSKPQAELYTLVLKAQQTAVAVIKPGVPYDEMHKKVIEVLTQGLVELGILKGKLGKLIEKEAYRPFFMHGTGHWLGMDVHDVGAYKKKGVWRAFEPGMVVTVEPGLYISDQHKKVDKKWHNIGIRIEDDVLVTQSGHEVLTKGLPRSVNEIETYMSQF